MTNLVTISNSEMQHIYDALAHIVSNSDGQRCSLDVASEAVAIAFGLDPGALTNSKDRALAETKWFTPRSI